MPALIDLRACDDSPHCGAARYCPKRNIEMQAGHWVIDAEACGSCGGVCVRACPPGAVRFAPTLAELEEIRLEIAESTETADDLFEKRYGVRPADPRSLGPNLDNVDCGSFDQLVVRSDLPVVVDFWAEWCAPCKVIAPTFKKLAAEYHGRMRFLKMDTEQCREIPGSLGIRSIPTLLFFKGGRVVGQQVGAVPEHHLRQSIDRVLTA